MQNSFTDKNNIYANRATRKHLKESQDLNMNFTVLEQLFQIAESQYFYEIAQGTEAFFNESIRPAAENREWLWNFVRNSDAIDKYLTSKITKVSDKKNKDDITDDVARKAEQEQRKIESNKIKIERDKVNAFITRTKRFRLKYVTIAYLINKAPRVVRGIEEKLKNIKNELQTRTVIINFSEPTNEDSKLSMENNITLASTINLMSKYLIQMENTLKELLPGLLVGYNLPYTGKYQIKFISKKIMDALISAAPPGFEGVERDNYYILRLLYNPMIVNFTADQRNQLECYLHELDLIFTFFLLDGETPSLDFTLLPTSKMSINIPFNKFVEQQPCSANTFGRIINAFNTFTVHSWALVLKHAAKCLEHPVTPNLELPSDSPLN
jgi:hypothetical protein